MSEQFQVLVTKYPVLRISIPEASWIEAKQAAENRLRLYLACAQDAARDKGYSLMLGKAEFAPEETSQDGVPIVEVSIPASIDCNQEAKTQKQAGERVVKAFDFALGCAAALAHMQKLTLTIEGETFAIISH